MVHPFFDSEESYEERKKYFYFCGPAVLYSVFSGGKCESRREPAAHSVG